MSDYQSIVENLRGFLGSTYQVKSPDLTAWAEEYARLCREANDRLLKCSDYMKKGLRGEAIHAADAPPNLLDVVAALDFPELADWKDACFRLELPAAPALMLDIAAALNEAYAQVQPIDGLLAHHRLLALGRAPLKDRLSIMRRIEDLDPTATVFADDIRAFERLRLEEIRGGVQAMARRNDADALQQVQAELKEKWRSDVPRDLRALVDNLSAQLRQASAGADIRRMMPALSDAYSAMSEPEARTVLGQITAAAAQAQMTIPADLQEQIDPISAWLTQKETQRKLNEAMIRACDALQQAIDTEAPTPRVEAAYRDVVRFQLDLPAQLEARYHEEIERRAVALRHKRLLAIGAGIGLFLLLGGIALVVVRQMLRSNEVKDAVALIQKAKKEIDDGNLDGGNLDRLRQMVKQTVAQHPAITADPAIISATSDFNAVATAEDLRQAQFGKHMSAVQAGGPDNPDAKELDAASQIARTPDEQKSVADWKSRIADAAHEKQSKFDEKFTRDVTALGKEIDEQVGTASSLGPAEKLKKIEALTARIVGMSQQPDVSAGLRQAQTNSLLAILKQRQAVAQESVDLGDLVTRVEKVRSTDDQSAALKAVLAKSGDVQAKGEFQQALDLIPQEQAIEAWGHASNTWATQPLPIGFDDAKNRQQDLDKYLQAHADSPLAKPVADYKEYVELGLAVASDKGPWKKSYHELMVNPLVHDLHVVTTSLEKHYFTMGKAAIKVRTPGGQVVAQEFSAITSSDVTQPELVSVHTPEVIRVEDAISPQAVYASATIKDLDKFNFADWETMGFRCQRNLIASTTMDPILRAILMHNLLNLNQGVCDWCGDTASKKVMDALASQNVDDVEWLNPKNPPQPALVSQVNTLLSQLPSSDQLETAVKSRRDRIMAALPMGLSVGGVLVRREGKAAVAMNDGAAGAAYAVNTSKQLVIVARRTEQGWAIDATTAPGVPAGSLLFVVPSAK